jgi:hypothetical protein
MKTGNGYENGGQGTVYVEKGYCVLLLFFSTALYRVFILWYEYPTRLFSICMYKGNVRMGI